MMSDTYTSEQGKRGAANLNREPANVRCTMCGKPIADCTVGGLHGMLRDRAAAAATK